MAKLGDAAVKNEMNSSNYNKGNIVTTNISTEYMLQDNITGEFFSSIGFQNSVITLPVLFGAKEFETEEDAYIFLNCNNHILVDFSVVKRTSTVNIEKV